MWRSDPGYTSYLCQKFVENEDEVDLLVILEVETNTWQIHKRLDASLAEFLWVTDTRALKNQWRTQSSARYDNLLACFDDPRWHLAARKVLGWDNLHTNSPIAFKDDLRDISSLSISTSYGICTFSTLLLVKRCRFWCTERVLWMYP